MAKRFKKFYIEVTSVCNLSCSFCPPTERQAKFIRVEDFAYTLDQVKPFTDHIYLHVKGEPTLHPKLDQLLDISGDKGFKVNLTTNGTLLHKAGPKLLGKPALRQINFSLHSEGVHMEGPNKQAYVRSILAFAREAADSGVTISLRLWNLETDNAENAARGRNRDILALLEQEFGLSQPIEESWERGKGLKLAERIYLNQDHEFKWPDLAEPEEEERGFCHGLRNQAGVLSDGTVIPCCLDGEGVINLGNIHERSFADIIEGERATRMYDGFSRREVVEELCRKCGYRRRFGVSGGA